MKDYYVDHEYDNTEVKYERTRDPRSVNVVEKIKNREKIKASIPQVSDDHVCVESLKKYVEKLEKDVVILKNTNAVSALKSLLATGGDIVLESSIDFEAALIIDKDTTIDLNCKTLTTTEDTEGEGVFHVTGGTLTINGNGCINGVGKNDYNMALWADGGNVVINDGTFTNVGATAEDDPSHFDLIYTKNGSTVEINGGFFRCATPKWTLNKNDKTESTIIVKGGTFVDYDPSHSETENPVANFVAEGYKVVAETQDNGEVWYTVVAE